MINTLSVTSIMIFQSKFQVTPYLLVNRSILCNCGIEVDSHHLLESLAACNKKLTKLTMNFTINLAFSNYLELMPKITDQLTLNRGKTNHEQPLPIYLNILHVMTIHYPTDQAN